MADSNYIKQEAYVKQETYVKPDPDALELATSHIPAVDDDDLYEDAGDLEFYDQGDGGSGYGQAYLARVPKYIWDAWASLPEDAEIELGTMRQWDVTHPDGKIEHRFKMLLSSDRPEHQKIPKEYDLDLGKELTRSTFVFTEEDLPGFKAKTKARTEASNAGIPASIMRARERLAEKPTEKKPFERRNRYQPYYRKAIPKKTKIGAKIQFEMNCVAVDNPESQAILQILQQETAPPKKTIRILGQHAAGGIIQHGSSAAVDKFGSFIKTTVPAKALKAKKSENKTARIPENELLDRLFAGFKRWGYWKMSVLRERYQQPEVYLRQTLDKIAFLNRTGPHANEWELREEFKQEAADATNETAPDTEALDDDDDNEVMMEDVLPGPSA